MFHGILFSDFKILEKEKWYLRIIYYCLLWIGVTFNLIYSLLAWCFVRYIRNYLLLTIHTHNEISANYNNTVMSRPVHPLLIKIKASKVRKRRSSSLNYFAFWDVRPFFYNSKWISCEKRNRGEVQTFNVPSTVRICVVFFLIYLLQHSGKRENSNDKKEPCKNICTGKS